MDGKCCSMDRNDEAFWDNHQTMSDGNIWCPVKSMSDKILNNARSQVRAKYGNKKRHRQ
jgi:hypothetical protein